MSKVSFQTNRSIGQRGKCLPLLPDHDGTKLKGVDDTVKTRDMAEVLWESVQ
ncbi:hypothetical protein [Acetonema longum]|uniref:Uncharacterized protein n=1 Tax=Acetonema longum DSM 6540 TaxID=1009370 RepID=F7NMX5_9FIRM|nr:hypothetical protein [Acetonema longum]EGO62619.1 hypothetical protein ALO_17291 [Acetonema longum DSM 6540]